MARGTLILLDAVPVDALFTPSYAERRAFLESLGVAQEPFSSGLQRGGESPLLLTTSRLPCAHDEALAFYRSLKQVNRELGAEFFEGLVMKRLDSPYPVQLRGSGEECRAWIKHRFLA